MSAIANKESETNTVDYQKEQEQALKILQTLSTKTGAIVSSKTGHYKSVWIRDNIFCSYAFEYLGDTDRAKQIVENVFDILMPYKEKIDTIVDASDPFAARSYIPSRFSAKDYTELPQEISYLHLDLPGLFLFRVAQMETIGYNIVNTDERRALVSAMIRYLEILEWPFTLEYGLWEEGPEVHTSTLACAVAGLEAIQKVYPDEQINTRMLEEGRRKMEGLLPTESATRPVDFCLLSAFWPLGLTSAKDAWMIIRSVQAELQKRRGLIRYPEDGYYNPRPDSPRGTEPRWPLGFAWLSIAWFTLGHYQNGMTNAEDKIPPAEECRAKGFEYLAQCRAQKDALGQLPELISGGEPNINTPFAWAEAFYIVANSLARQAIELSPEAEGEAVSAAQA